MNINPPCYNCTNRELGCHGKCEKYLTFKQKKSESNQVEREVKERYWDYVASIRHVKNQKRKVK